MQAYVRLLEQEVSAAAEREAQLRRRLADTPGEAAAEAEGLQNRAAAAEAVRCEALQQLQVERRR